MRVRRHIIGATVAVLAGLGAPSPASAGGVDPTRHCIQAAVNEFVYDPYSARNATRMVVQTKECGKRFGAHVSDSQKRMAWERCLEYGVQRTLLTVSWDPLVDAVYNCTARWLEFEVQIDPYP